MTRAKAKLEAAYKGDMVQAVKDAGGYARRVEDQYAVGTLDLILCLPSTGIVLAEAKRFTSDHFEPSPRQFIEMCDIDDGGGVALLIGVKLGKFYLHGTNRADPRRGRVLERDCITGSDFVPTFERWYKAVIHNER